MFSGNWTLPLINISNFHDKRGRNMDGEEREGSLLYTFLVSLKNI